MTDTSVLTGRHAARQDVTEPEDGSDRGETRIADRVVERIAAQSVREIDNATGSVRRVLGLSLGSTRDETGAQVTARVDGPLAVIDLRMTVIYPSSVRDVTRNTRRHIIDRVLGLTGVTVQEIDITVDGMTVRRAEPSRVR